MPPKAETHYYSFEKRVGPINFDNAMTIICSTFLTSLGIGYCIYLAYR